ncbi:MAG: NtaA/DmoA family FMN-dependent monooxygenase [Microbacterium sp.]|uniref:NtaA/DmoA family FMN-dependent monooxygenase n=1 Tax=Microbacterium sp. TaxID=51671 RepID=UPI0026084D1F|nr:NtaA/DmoA family FMN-dependent monooxygenase [Microbacterium sp.]MCX6502509.1 NtaA/DmoA family FMN-dependent monooxygenase [Microbacterium sp.]
MPEKQLVLAAYEEFTPNFVNHTWHLPRSISHRYSELGFWQEYVRELDAAGFDFLFLAEALGYPMTDDGAVPDAVIREAVQMPVLDPVALISALAATVDRLGFVVTASTTSQVPYLHARTFTTLDHITAGRIGWNIVTTDQQNALTRLLGMDAVVPHGERYDRATEFVELVLQLWEGAWEDDAVVADKAARVYADPAKVHRIRHDGRYFSLDGYFPATPSPQRTPTLFQAGTSDRGKEFAAAYAECIFTSYRDTASAAAHIGDLRARARTDGRELVVLNGVSVVVGDTTAEAEAERADLDAAPSRDAAAALFLGWTGVDLSALGHDTLLADLDPQGSKTTFALWGDNPATPTVGALLDQITSESGGFKATGTALEVADQLEAIARDGDIDGFLMECTYGGIESHRRFIAEVMPILRERGLLPAEPRGGSLRERLTASATPRLAAPHPAVKYRH